MLKFENTSLLSTNPCIPRKE